MAFTVKKVTESPWRRGHPDSAKGTAVTLPSGGGVAVMGLIRQARKEG